MKKSFLILILFIFIFYSKYRYKSIFNGISYKEAVKIVNSKKNWFIIREEYYTESELYIDYGRNKNKRVFLDKDPLLANLKKEVFMSEKNRFLIKGKEINKEYINKNFDEGTPFATPVYTIKVEYWQLITPINRDYTYSNHWRFFYPKDYLDEYDLKNGDYTP